MKKNPLFFAVFFFLISTLHGQTYTIVENNFNRVRILFNSSEISSVDVATEQGRFSRISMQGATPSRIIGCPELPVITEQMEIPLCDHVSYEIISADYDDYSAAELGIRHTLYPAQPAVFKSRPASPFVRDTMAYQTNEFFGDDLIRVEKSGVLRNINLATVYFSPVQYNPVADIYRIHTRVEVVFTFENADIPATYEMKSLHGNSLFNGLQSKVMNPIAPLREPVFTHPVKYLIVAHSMFRDQFNDFVTWKKRCGFDVETAYTDDADVGTSATSIAAFIKRKYTDATPDNPAPSYVLLIGDIAQIPVFNGESDNHKTDLYYFTWTSGDHFPDCFYGRFSVQNVTQLRTMLNKTMQYEQVNMPDPGYLDKAVLVAGTDPGWSPTHANGQMNYLYNNYINENEANYETVYLHLYNSSGQAAAIRQEIGAGVGYANYTAHCSESGWADPEFLTDQIPAMNNADKYCFMVGNCCLSNKFDEDECFGEALTRTANKGAVAYIGGTNSTIWDEDFYWSVGVRSSITAQPAYDAGQMGAYDRMFHTHNEPFDDWHITGSSMIMAGNLAIESSTSDYKLYYWEVYHILGDPSIMPWFTQPEAMEVSVSDVLVAGATSMEVSAVPYAYVALTANGEVIAATTANDDGSATLNFAGVEPGINYELAVSAQHYQTRFQTITVIVPEGGYVVASHPRLHANDLPNYGTSFSYDVILRNVGTADASNITSTLTATGSEVTIDQNMISLPTLAAGAEQNMINAFRITAADDIPDGTVAHFTITTQYDSTQTTTAVFNQTLAAPRLSNLWSKSVELQGNNNGSNDAGETCALRIATLNGGHAAAIGVHSVLTCPYDKATIQNSELSLGDIAAGETAISEFVVQLDSTVPNPFIIPFIHHVMAGSYSLTDTLYLFVGHAMEDFESATLTEYNWITGGNPWRVTTTNPHEGSYCASPKNNMSYETSSTLSLSIEAAVNDSISFYRRLSSRSWYGENKLNFFIDDTQMESLADNTPWSRAAFPVSAGRHTIKFELYCGGYGGEYSAGVDDINFPMYGEMAPLAMEEFTSNTLSCYPNPTTGRVNIALPESLRHHFTVALFDLNGKKLTSENVTSSGPTYTFDVHSLASGIYIISVFNEENLFTGKFVKK